MADILDKGVEIFGEHVPFTELQTDIDAAKNKGLSNQFAFTPETVQALLDCIAQKESQLNEVKKELEIVKSNLAFTTEQENKLFEQLNEAVEQINKLCDIKCKNAWARHNESAPCDNCATKMFLNSIGGK